MAYKKKLYPEKCYLCGKVRMVRKERLLKSKFCRACAYTINAFRINSYIKRPPRGPDGRYFKIHSVEIDEDIKIMDDKNGVIK